MSYIEICALLEKIVIKTMPKDRYITEESNIFLPAACRKKLQPCFTGISFIFWK
jgi:hypothetical protein